MWQGSALEGGPTAGSLSPGCVTEVVPPQGELRGRGVQGWGGGRNSPISHHSLLVKKKVWYGYGENKQ